MHGKEGDKRGAGTKVTIKRRRHMGVGKEVLGVLRPAPPMQSQRTKLSMIKCFDHSRLIKKSLFGAKCQLLLSL
jgi:hypothetical protein